MNKDIWNLEAGEADVKVVLRGSVTWASQQSDMAFPSNLERRYFTCLMSPGMELKVMGSG